MKVKGYRKLLSVMLVCSMLATMPSSEAFAADIAADCENTGADAAAEVSAETEENVMGSDIGAKEQEGSETEDMASEEDDGEKETGETVSENSGPEDAGEGPEGTEVEEPQEGAAEEEVLPEDVLTTAEDVAEAALTESGETSGSCGANVTWRLADGVLTISGSGAMEDYGHEIRVPWHEYCTDIKRAVVEEDITAIGENAFCGCSSLTGIELPSSVTSIGMCAFSGCSSLTGIELPSGVTAIGRSAFHGCSSLISIELPSGVTAIGEYAFFMCSSLTDIELSSSVTSIGMFAFSCCSRLASIELPSGVTAIGGHAFEACRSLTSIELPSGVTVIEESVFERCNSLVSIELPSGITALGEQAFRECSSLTNIELPSDVTTIEASAFHGCSSLISIELPSGVTTIGEYAFYCCSRLKNIKLPSGITTIGEYAFCACGGLTNIELPLGITNIEYGTFCNCSSLTSIEIPSGVTTIGESAFSNCTKMADVYYGGSESDWSAITIGEYNEPLTSATIHYDSESDESNDSTLAVKSRSFAFTDPQTVQLNWGWKYILNRDSTEYIHDVSTVALALSAATERSQNDIESMLTGDNFGVDAGLIKSINYSEAEQETNHPACTFAHKTINNGGKTEHIIILVGRGTTSSTDFWGTDLGSIGNHFEEPASNVWRSFLGWLNTSGLADEINGSNTKFFVTGHSLGGAVANRIAYRLTQDYGRANVYAYTFGTPPTEGQTSTYVPNIFNVLYDWDPVPFAGVFTDGRYGIECWFTDDDRGRFLSKHYVQSYMKRLLNGADRYFRKSMKGGGAWCPVDLRIYNSSGELVGSVTNNAVDQENVTDSVLIVLSGENKDQKNFYFFDDDTYDIELIGKDNGTLTYTIRDTSADKQTITERVYSNVVLTPGKRMTSSVSVWDKTDPTISTEDKIDTPQVQLFVLDDDDNIVREVLPDGSGTEIPYTGPNEVLPGDIPADGNIPDGLWIAGVADSYTYTGAAIKPVIRVYDGKKRLQPGKDYTVSYKNNTRTNDASNLPKAPAVVVRGRGNYVGTETATFKIAAVALDDNCVNAEDMTIACNKRVQKKVPIVTYSGRKLTKNRDFTVSYPNAEPGAYKEPGTYDILLTAKTGGNFSGTRVVKYTITDNILLAKVNVKKIPNQTYTGAAIEPDLSVTYRNTPLIKGTDYLVSYADNTEIGTAKAVLTGIGKYAETKSIAFKITGTVLRSNAVSGIKNKVYNGNYQEQNFAVIVDGRTLTEGTDYEVVYANNRDVGRASVTIRGKGAYTGTIKKTFQIGQFDIAANAGGSFTAEVKQDVIPYAKGGAKPEVAVRFRNEDGKWQKLAEGRDYTLSYRNHTAVNDGSRTDRRPTVTVKGKGSFRGTFGTALNYKIIAQDIGQLTLTAADKVWQNKGNVYKTKVVVKDVDQKVLGAGRDYDNNPVYTYHKDTRFADGTVKTAGTVISAKEMIPAGTTIGITVHAKGPNYYGEIYGTYRITKADISKAAVKIPAQIYTGKAIKPDDEIDIRLNRAPLPRDNYEITDYGNNVNRGTATVTIRGKNDCGGTKTVRFTIKSKGFLWWWR